MRSIDGGMLILSLLLAGPAAGGGSIPLPGEHTVEDNDRGWGEVVFSSIEFRGYVENTLTAEWDQDDDRAWFLNGIRARVNLCGAPNDYVDFAVGAVALLYSGRTEWEMAGYLPLEEQAKLVPPDPNLGLPGTTDLLKAEFETEVYFQEAFGTLHLPRFRLRVGRQKFYTGTGYAYNPIDLFNLQDPMDPTYEIDGFDAALAALLLPCQTEIQGLLEFGERPGRWNYMGRLKTHALGWDLAVQYTHTVRERTDFVSLNTSDGIASAVGGGAPARKFRWHLIGGELAGEFLGVGFHAEGGYVFAESLGASGSLARAADDHERWLVGMDYTFESQVYLIAEYLRFGQGRSETSDITLNDRLGALTGEILSANRDNLFTGVSYPLTDLAEISLYGIVALNDPSAVINPWYRLDLLPGLNLWFTLYVPVGGEKSQNGRAGTSGFTRLKFSF